MATAAVINAAWDLAAKAAGKPLWRYLSDLSPDRDRRPWSTSGTSPTPSPRTRRATSSSPPQPGRASAARRSERDGYPAYTTTPGWLGYDDEKLVRLSKEAVADGYGLIKLKVGANLDDDIRRLALVRAAVGEDVRIAVDANQRWDVGSAVAWMTALAPFRPWWIEEPTSPDDVLGHAAIRSALAAATAGGDRILVATGEHVQNRIIFKQLLQADAIDVVQLDACRVGGVNENLAILLLAAKFGKPVCPHAGGVGLCELVRHLSMFDFVAVSGTTDNRMIEYVDHLHEHFLDPAVVRAGAYVGPHAAGVLRPDAPGVPAAVRVSRRARVVGSGGGLIWLCYGLSGGSSRVDGTTRRRETDRYSASIDAHS